MPGRRVSDASGPTTKFRRHYKHVKTGDPENEGILLRCCTNKSPLGRTKRLDQCMDVLGLLDFRLVGAVPPSIIDNR